MDKSKIAKPTVHVLKSDHCFIHFSSCPPDCTSVPPPAPVSSYSEPRGNSREGYAPRATTANSGAIHRRATLADWFSYKRQHKRPKMKPVSKARHTSRAQCSQRPSRPTALATSANNLCRHSNFVRPTHTHRVDNAPPTTHRSPSLLSLSRSCFNLACLRVSHVRSECPRMYS